MLPKELKIGGFTYRVQEVSGLADCGTSDFDNLVISIKKEQSLARQQSALLHEVIECVNEIGDLNLSHQTIQTLEAMLFQIAVSNKLV